MTLSIHLSPDLAEDYISWLIWTRGYSRSTARRYAKISRRVDRACPEGISRDPDDVPEQVARVGGTTKTNRTYRTAIYRLQEYLDDRDRRRPTRGPEEAAA